MTFLRLRGLRTFLLTVDYSTFSHFLELRRVFRDRLGDGPPCASTCWTAPMGFLPVPRIKVRRVGVQLTLLQVPGLKCPPLLAFRTLSGAFSSTSVQPCFMPLTCFGFLPSKLFSSDPTLPHSSCGDPSSTLPKVRCCQLAPRRPRGFLSDRKPYRQPSGISRCAEAVAPLVVSSHRDQACAGNRCGWPLRADKSARSSAAGLS